MLSHVRIFGAPWTVACQTPLPMKFSGQEYWKGLPFPPSGDLLHPEIKPVSPKLVGGFFNTEPPAKLKYLINGCKTVQMVSCGKEQKKENT